MPETGSSMARSLLSPIFLVCAVILGAAAVALRPGMAALERRYRKESIPLRRPLAQFDITRLASFKKPLGKPRLQPADVSDEAIGTKECLWVLLQEKNRAGGEGQVALFVTYYSNPGDQVPHTPEVCYRQGGGVVTGLTTTAIETPELAPEHPSITVRKLNVGDPGGDLVVLYVFCANGEFSTDRQHVRWINAMPGDRYVYFSKIETIAPLSPDEPAGAAVERGKKLLREALPILVQAHFPDSKDLRPR